MEAWCKRCGRRHPRSPRTRLDRALGRQPDDCHLVGTFYGTSTRPELRRALNETGRSKVEAMKDADALYRCEKCPLVWPHSLAVRHGEEHGHAIIRLPLEEQRSVIESWQADDRCWRCGSAEHFAAGCPF